MKKLMIAIFAIGAMASCKKESVHAPIVEPLPITNPTPVPTVVGFWVGKYGSGNAAPSYGYAMLLRSNGTVRVFDNSDTTIANKAEGIYTLENGTLKTNYKYTSGNGFSSTATVSSDMKSQTGTWGTALNSSDGGTYFLSKQ